MSEAEPPFGRRSTGEGPDDPVYPRILPPAPESLPEVLERTRFRASLAPEYLEGRAPEAQRRGAQEVDPSPTYYGLPAIKRPDWEWYVPAYFVTGGIAAGGYIIAALADMSGRDEDRVLVRAGRIVALLALGASPPLLIADLGRPERFHHMLRVFRPRSMMNQGSWALTIFGGFVGLSTLMELVAIIAERRVPSSSEDGGCLPIRQQTPAVDVLHGKLRSNRGGVRALSRGAAPLGLAVRAFSWLGIVPAAYVGSYTGVLLSATNVPLWAANRYFLGPRFFASALSSGAAATHLTAQALGPVSEGTEERLDRVERATQAVECVLEAASALSVGKFQKSLYRGRMSTLYKIGYLGLGLAAPFVLRQVGKKHRWARTAASVLSLASAAALKFSVTEAGKESADDPHEYFEYTRADGSERR